MSTYRVRFNISYHDVEELMVLSDGSPFPIWDSVGVVENVIARLHPDVRVVPLERSGAAIVRSTIVMSAWTNVTLSSSNMWW